jgi:hypothetical protein
MWNVFDLYSQIHSYAQARCAHLRDVNVVTGIAAFFFFFFFFSFFAIDLITTVILIPNSPHLKTQHLALMIIL